MEQVTYTVSYKFAGMNINYPKRYKKLGNAVKRAKKICLKHNFLVLVSVKKTTVKEEIVRTV